MLYAVRRGNSTDPWTISRVAQDVWTDSSLGFDAVEQCRHQLPRCGSRAAYVRGDSTLSTWVVSAVDGPDAGAFNSLAVAPSGQPAIAYTSEDDHRTLIRYAAFDGATWRKDTVGEGTGWCTIAFSPSGTPAIVYAVRRDLQYSVSYATPGAGSWRRESIATPASSPSLAFTPAGEPAVSYHDEDDMAIILALRVDRTWSRFVVQHAGKDNDGIWHGDFTLTSLAFTPSGQPAISYYDRHHGSIKCAIGTITTT